MFNGSYYFQYLHVLRFYLVTVELWYTKTSVLITHESYTLCLHHLSAADCIYGGPAQSIGNTDLHALHFLTPSHRMPSPRETAWDFDFAAIFDCLPLSPELS